jgi:glycosyltransferase involved in cell wall biosynthesis
MRLLITTDTVGGVWRFSQELTRGLLDAGCAVALVSFGRQPSASQLSECQALTDRWSEQFRFISTEIPLEWMQENWRSLDEGTPLLEKTTREFGAELLHSNQFCFGAVQVGIPTVITAHSDVLSWGRACRSGDMEDSEWLRSYCMLVQRGLDKADALTAPTVWMLQALGEGFSLPLQKRVISNGRTLPALGKRVRRLQAVTTGRLWDEAKDVALLEHVKSPMPLLLAGDTECDGVRSGIMSGVSLLGQLNEEEIVRLFKESTAYVCTSCYEPFGLAPLEAALCGCAVVARSIDSLREVWGEDALYFGNAEELSQILTRLHVDAAMRADMQERAYKRAHRYSRERMTKHYLELFTMVTTRTREAAGVA